MEKICIYHGNCADGFGAALAVWLRFGSACEFHPGVYGQEPPDVTGKQVIIVDYSYKPEVLKEMATKARSILIIDHHKSAYEDVKNYENNPQLFFDMSNWESPVDWDRYESNLYQDRCEGIGTIVYTYFDMNRSGALMAWEFFMKTPAPKLIRHISDRDLWKFELAGTREIQAALFSYPYDFKIWQKLVLDDACAELWKDGIAIERKHFKDIAELLKLTTRHMIIGGHKVRVANLPYTMASDAGHELAHAPYPFGACYYDSETHRVFSLRSIGEFDVSEIARKYGGGGHRNAAGFRVPLGWEGDND